MKKSILIGMIILLLLSACGEKQKKTTASSDVVPTLTTESKKQIEQIVIETPKEKAEPKYTHAVFELNIVETLLSNDSVGQEWFNVYSFNGEYISSGKRWVVPLDKTETVTIDAFITEDDVHPDTAFNSSQVVLSDGFETTKIIKVTENNGRNKGKNAQWEIIYRVKLVDKLVR